MFRLFVWQSICFQLFPWAAVALCVSALQAPTNPTQNSTEKSKATRASLHALSLSFYFISSCAASCSRLFFLKSTLRRSSLAHSLLLVTLLSNRGRSEFDRRWRPAIPVFHSVQCVYIPFYLHPPSLTYLVRQLYSVPPPKSAIQLSSYKNSDRRELLCS